MKQTLPHRHSPIAQGCALLLASLASLSQAQDIGQPAPTSNKSASQLDRVEVTGRSSDTELRRRSSVSRQVYGRDEIDKYGDTNVADVLKRLPGVDLQGNTPRMRGLGAGYTQILLNGDPAPPGFQFDQLDPALVERIEITKGATVEHSAQAMAGTINIILRDAPRVSSKELVLGAGGPRGSGRGMFTLNEKKGDWSWSLPVGVFAWSGDQHTTTERRTSGLDGQPAASVQQSDTHFWGQGVNLMPRINRRLSEDSSIGANAFLQKGWWNNSTRVQTLSQTGLPRLDDPLDSNGTWENARLGVNYSNQFDENQKLELKGGFNHSLSTYTNLTTRPAPPQWQAVGRSGEDGFTQAGKYIRSLGERHSLVLGWDLEQKQRQETRNVTVGGAAQLPAAYANPFVANILRTAVYAQDEWNATPKLGLSLGLRGERISTRSQDLAGQDLANSSVVWTPMLHATYKFDPNARDLLRMSVTRSYKAPTLAQMMARPNVNILAQDLTQTNTVVSADSMGNPALKPELATGLDVAYEKYLSGGGMVSVGGFYRQVKGLIRTQTQLMTVPWASAPRWVSMPSNFSSAQTAGLELEIKGRVGEWLPLLADAKTPWNVRSGLNVYRSRVSAIQGPNNRLEGQQPWSLTLGTDYRLTLLPLMVGGNLTYTPAYDYRSTDQLTTWQSPKRNGDLFAQYFINRATTLRASVMFNPWGATGVNSQAFYSNGDYVATHAKGLTWYGAQLTMKF